jgi:WD40 repeat protein
MHRLKVPVSVVQAVAFSQDGKLLAASADEVVKVWDLASGKEVHSFRGPRDKLMRGLAFGANGAVLASACSDGTVTLRDVATGKVLDAIKVGVEAYRVSMSADGRVLAVTADDQFARVYDVSAATAGRPPR